jgi:hypothetical protein
MTDQERSLMISARTTNFIRTQSLRWRYISPRIQGKANFMGPEGIISTFTDVWR